MHGCNYNLANFPPSDEYLGKRLGENLEGGGGGGVWGRGACEGWETPVDLKGSGDFTLVSPLAEEISALAEFLYYCFTLEMTAVLCLLLSIPGRCIQPKKGKKWSLLY